MFPAHIGGVQPESFGPFVGAPAVESREQIQDGYQTFSWNFTRLPKGSSHILVVNHVVGQLTARREQPAPQASEQLLLASAIERVLEKVHQLGGRAMCSQVD